MEIKLWKGSRNLNGCARLLFFATELSDSDNVVSPTGRDMITAKLMRAWNI